MANATQIQQMVVANTTNSATEETFQTEPSGNIKLFHLMMKLQ